MCLRPHPHPILTVKLFRVEHMLRNSMWATALLSAIERGSTLCHYMNDEIIENPKEIANRVLQPDPTHGPGRIQHCRLRCGLDLGNMSDLYRVTLFNNLLACSLLAIPASSVASERIFIQTERILEALCQQLSPNSLDCIMFFKKLLVYFVNLIVI